MIDDRPVRFRVLTGLSGRLLVLTMCFIMLAEVLIYLPSVARFRKVYLEDQIAKAHLAALALEASDNATITNPLAMDLLLHAGARAIVLKVPDRRMLMLSDKMPPTVDATFDLRHETFFDWIGDALVTLSQRDGRVLRIVDAAPRDPDAIVEVLLDERPLRQAMYAFSWRILTLSIIISLIAGSLVYLVLQWQMVRPIVRLTEAMVRFRRAPEDEWTTIVSSRRSDEIGIAERELAAVQRDLRAALRQKARLATLGSAVAKIHHDLRNTLATAMLASDRLATIDDPEVQRVTPRLFQAIDRAVELTSRTMDFLREDSPPIRETVFSLRELLAEVDASVCTPDGRRSSLSAAQGAALDLSITGDRQQLFRVFSNLAINALQSGARSVEVDASVVDNRIRIDMRDNGPGITESARDRLFLPFVSSQRREGTSRGRGTGLGLVIAREIVAAHGGRLDLAETGADGTTFRIDLPVRGAPTTPS
jgi:signal transduction histidine kinase